MALRLTGHHEDAEDLVQDTIVKAYQAYGRARFEGPAGFRGWLFTILANGFRDRYRRRGRSPEVTLHPSEDDPDAKVIELVPDFAPGPEVQVETTLFSEAAHEVIERMAPEIRLAVMLFFVEGCTYQEIADIAGCPVGTVMSRLWRGRRILRKSLARFGEEAPLSARRVKVKAS